MRRVGRGGASRSSRIRRRAPPTLAAQPARRRRCAAATRPGSAGSSGFRSRCSRWRRSPPSRCRCGRSANTRSRSNAVADAGARSRRRCPRRCARSSIAQVGDYNFALERKYAFPGAVQVARRRDASCCPTTRGSRSSRSRPTASGKDAQRELLIRGESANAGRLVHAARGVAAVHAGGAALADDQDPAGAGRDIRPRRAAEAAARPGAGAGHAVRQARCGGGVAAATPGPAAPAAAPDNKAAAPDNKAAAPDNKAAPPAGPTPQRATAGAGAASGPIQPAAPAGGGRS